MSSLEESYDIHKWPGMSREDELYREETERMTEQKGGEENVTWEDNEEITQRVRARLTEEGLREQQDV